MGLQDYLSSGRLQLTCAWRGELPPYGCWWGDGKLGAKKGNVLSSTPQGAGVPRGAGSAQEEGWEEGEAAWVLWARLSLSSPAA